MKAINLLGVCRTLEEQNQGLMFVRSIPEDSGLLFAYDTPQFLSFWMANTFIPLQVAFIEPGNRIARIRRLQPLSRQSVLSIAPCIGAIEVRDGTFDRLEIEVGDLVEIDEKDAKIIFRKCENYSA